MPEMIEAKQGGGLVKKEQPAWQDTNMALFGSDLEKKIKKASAECEGAWDGVGQKEELRIWRIEQFKVVEWPEDKHGMFHVGDSYIILKVTEREREELEGLAGKRKDDTELDWNIHFWIGRESSQDEYGTAAYKTVELDHLLDDRATQHRETQHNETQMFRSYFKDIEYLPGGTKTGFNRIADIVHLPILFKIKGVEGRVVITEEELSASSLCSGDVYVLDASDCDKGIFLWQGAQSNKEERTKAQEFASSLRGSGGKKHSSANATVITEGTTAEAIAQSDEDDEGFWGILGGRTKLCGMINKVRAAEDGGSDRKAWKPQLLRVTNESSCFRKEGLRMSVAETGHIVHPMFEKDDVFIFDPGYQIFVWVGQESSAGEQRSAMIFAQQYLAQNKRPLSLPITQVKQKNETAYFKACVCATKERVWVDVPEGM